MPRHMPGKEDAGPVAGIVLIFTGIVIPFSEVFNILPVLAAGIPVCI